MVREVEMAVAHDGETTRILFVDDEPQVLTALKSLLRTHDHGWDVVYADGGLAALSALERQRFDVVVSDLRMPHVDGAELLAQVKRDQPGAIRLLVSGQADEEAPPAAVLVAHQLLPKPCDPAALSAAIDRARLIRGIIDDDTVQRISDRLGQLPAPPRIYWAITRAGAHAEPALRETVALIERDHDVATRLVDLANWPYASLARRARTIEEAAEVLGTDLVRAFAVAASAFTRWPTHGLPPELSFARLRAHTFATARIARRIATRPDDAAHAFAAALLHDLGHLVIAVCFPERVPAILQRTGRGELVEHAQSRELGFDHAAIGAYLLGIWGLPAVLVEAVADHVAPQRRPRTVLDVAGLLHVASALAGEHMPSTWGGARPPWLDMQYLQQVGVADRMPQWHWVAQEEAEAATHTIPGAHGHDRG
jgi:HD-like signal output (HDOD) protein/ActR/RegA family two-component response regulator